MPYTRGGDTGRASPAPPGGSCTGSSRSSAAFSTSSAIQLNRIFTDVLIMLISLGYSSSYPVVFRNSGFAVATVLIRLALTAPPYVNALLGLASALFVTGLSLAYNAFSPLMRDRPGPPPTPYG